MYRPTRVEWCRETEQFEQRKKLTARDFLERFASKMNKTLDDVIEAGFRVAPCYCSTKECEGWRMTVKEDKLAIPLDDLNLSEKVGA
jgi:hypothetical protein